MPTCSAFVKSALRKVADLEGDYTQPHDGISPGMEVETSGEALGEQDVTKPKVADVKRDPEGKFHGVVVEKGAVFRKKLDVPAGSVKGVKRDTGKVLIHARGSPSAGLRPAYGPGELSDPSLIAYSRGVGNRGCASRGRARSCER